MGEQGAVLVFDVTDADSFDDLGNWVVEAKKFGLKNCPIAVCGNKVPANESPSHYGLAPVSIIAFPPI